MPGHTLCLRDAVGDGEVVRGDEVFAVAIGRQVRCSSGIHLFIHPLIHS